MFTLTLSKVVKACRKAYNEKRLSAQAADPAMRKCQYRVGEYRCAIGAALPTKVLDMMDKTTLPATAGTMTLIAAAIKTVSRENIINIPPDDLFYMGGLQIAHDNWCRARLTERSKARNMFLKTLEKLEQRIVP